MGKIRNVLLRNIIARGVGANLIHGHADSPLENISFENIRLTIVSDPGSPLQKSGHAITIENARNIRLKDVEIVYEDPASDEWQSGLFVQNVDGLTLDSITAQEAPNNNHAPAVNFKNVERVDIRNCRF